MDNNIQLHQKELCNKLWSMANALRGNMEAYEFKNYILGMIFYYYLSDRTEKYIKIIQNTARSGGCSAGCVAERGKRLLHHALRQFGKRKKYPSHHTRTDGQAGLGTVFP